MKTLEQLGISPAPWFITKHGEIYSQEGFIFGIKRVELGARVVFTTGEDACLIAASPKLYDRAQKLVSAFDRREMTPEHVEALRAALAEAAGEEVSDGE